VIAYERLTGVEGDVERFISVRQESPSSYAVSVPQFETAECCRVLLEAYLVEEHVWRFSHPRQVPDPHVADITNPLAVALADIADPKRPMFGTHKRLLLVLVRITCVKRSKFSLQSQGV